MTVETNKVESVAKASDVTTKAAKGVWIKTFGCQMNEYDSEKMFGLLSDDYKRVERPEDAELAIVNTCSIREKAEHKLFSLLGRLQELKEENPKMIIGVGGCVAQQEGIAISKRNRAVDFVVGTHNLSLIPSLVERAKQGGETGVAIDYRDEWEELPAELANTEQQNSYRALVAIQRGCNKHCAFCVVPNTRGEQVSRQADEIVREITLKARLGAKEVMLLGQTVNSYGLDLQPRVKFEELIRRVAEIDGIERIRFISPHPQEVKPKFIDLYSSVPELCPHIHLPLQSGSDRVLKLMNRNYRRKRYLEIVQQLKEARPNIAISTDIIVGFPTETEQDFKQSLEIVESVGYSMSFSFTYSKRPGTEALKHSAEHEVPLEVAKERLRRLQDLQTKITLEQNSKWVGETVEVLIEGSLKKSPEVVKGRIPENTLVELLPENSDSPKPKAGEIVRAEILRASPHALKGLIC